MIRIAERAPKTLDASQGPDLWRLILNHLDRFHFWYVLILSIGLLVAAGVHAIEGRMVETTIPFLAGHYLGRAGQSRRVPRGDRNGQ